MLSPKSPPKAKSSEAPSAPKSANAVITRLDGKGAFTFEVPPQVLRWSYKNIFNALAVLRTSQPLVNYQYSEGALSLSTCYFWEVDISALRDLMKPEGEEPPLCSFMWGDIVLPRVYIAALDISETSRTDKTLEAEGAITFVFAPEPVNPPKLPPIVTLTNREVDALQQVVSATAKKDPKLQAKLGGVPIVNDKGEIEVLGKVKALVTDVIKKGDKLVSGKPKLSDSKQKLLNAAQKTPRESLQNSKK